MVRIIMPPAGVFLVPARKTRKNRLGEALTAQPIGVQRWSFCVTPASSRPPQAPSRQPGLSTGKCLSCGVNASHNLQYHRNRGFQRGKRRICWLQNFCIRFPLWSWERSGKPTKRFPAALCILSRRRESMYTLAKGGRLSVAPLQNRSHIFYKNLRAKPHRRHRASTASFRENPS